MTIESFNAVCPKLLHIGGLREQIIIGQNPTPTDKEVTQYFTREISKFLLPQSERLRVSIPVV